MCGSRLFDKGEVLLGLLYPGKQSLGNLLGCTSWKSCHEWLDAE